ncbi:phage tail tape measure protein [Planococcus dechangensis]|uniref:Phage tail tape measure protein n=1 Tax=Planococcus dechangensis TaxID=1176255 RepID=A0ABV9ME29_9BACL
MAERIEGLSIGLGLDTLGIDKGMSELKRKLAGVNSEMKANMSAFDRNEVSVKKYETQLKGLNKRLDLQKVAVQNAKDEYEKMVKIHGEGSTQADKAAGIYNKEAASLNNLNRYVEGVTEEFKAFQKEQEIAESRLGKLSKAMENMGNKMKSVGDGMKNVGTNLTKGITAPLVGIGVAAFSSANEFDKASKNIRAGTGATGDALEDLETSFKSVFKSVPEDAETVSNALADINTRTGLTGEPLEKMTKQFLDLSRVTGEDVNTSIADMTRTFGTWGVEMEDSGDTMDYLWKVAQTTGIGVSELTGLLDTNGETFQTLGYNIEESAALLGHWEKSGVNSEVMLTGLKKGLQNLAAAGEDPAKVLPGLISDIENAGTESESTSLAMELFGKKAGPEMAKAIRDGNLSVDELLSTLDSSGETIGSAAEDTMSLADQFTLLKNNSMAALEPIGTILLDLTKKYLPPLIDAMSKMAERFENFSDKTQKSILVFGGIAAAIGPVLVVVGSMISMFGGAMITLAPFLLKVKEAGGWFKYLRLAVAALTGPVGLTIAVIAALTAGFIPLYRNSETFRTGVQALIQRVKELATTGLTMIKPAIAAVTGFFKNQLSTIQKFWSENSVVILSALSNISKVTASIMKGIMAVIQFVMPAVLAIIRSVWGNIKGVINGALNVIMGGVKVFAGLFSGDFKKMWEGVKQMFSGAVQFIWNFVQLSFFGKVLGGARLFVKSFSGVFSTMWTSMKTLFSTSVTTVLRNVTTAWSTMRTSTSTAFRQIFDSVKNRFTDIVNAAKALPKRIGDGIGSMASKVKSGVTKVINNLASTLGKGVNGVITGINWVLDKIGVGKAGKVDLWTVPQYANGTHAHPGGPAIVGDGRGLNAGRELIQTPSGELGLSPAIDTMVNLPKGTQVLSAKKTRELLGEIPHYESGTGLWQGIKNFGSAAWEGTKAAGSAIKDAAFNVWDHVSNPGKLLDTALSLLGIKKPNGGSLVGDMAKGAFDKVKTGALGFLKSSIDESGTMAGSGHGFGSAFTLTSRRGFRINPVTGIGQMHQGDDWGARAGTLIPAQAAGKVIQAGFHAIRGNFVRVQSGIMDRLYQHNQRNLVSVGQAVKKGQAVGTVGSTGRSTGPHLHYEVRRNGININPAGLETGGITKTDQLVRISEKNREEITIPMHKSRRSDAMKLMAIAGKKLMSGGKSGGGITRPNQLPNPSPSKDNEIINLLKQQVALLQALLTNPQPTQVAMVTPNYDVLAEGVAKPVEKINNDRNAMKDSGRKGRTY